MRNSFYYYAILWRS